uniref:DEAD domain-containing protein n=1 Tax=Parastrongyloides trichosuri TaxID=131310 RepID=A0A0N4ZJ35_PARTI
MSDTEEDKTPSLKTLFSPQIEELLNNVGIKQLTDLQYKALKMIDKEHRMDVILTGNGNYGKTTSWMLGLTKFLNYSPPDGKLKAIVLVKNYRQGELLRDALDYLLQGTNHKIESRPNISSENSIKENIFQKSIWIVYPESILFFRDKLWNNKAFKFMHSLYYLIFDDIFIDDEKNEFLLSLSMKEYAKMMYEKNVFFKSIVTCKKIDEEVIFIKNEILRKHFYKEINMEPLDVFQVNFDDKLAFFDGVFCRK